LVSSISYFNDTWSQRPVKLFPADFCHVRNSPSYVMGLMSSKHSTLYEACAWHNAARAAASATLDRQTFVETRFLPHCIPIRPRKERVPRCRSSQREVQQITKFSASKRSTRQGGPTGCPNWLKISCHLMDQHAVYFYFTYVVNSSCGCSQCPHRVLD